MAPRKLSAVDKGKQVATQSKKRKTTSTTDQPTAQRMNFNTQEYERFEKFRTRKFIKNKCLNWEVLRQLNMEDEVKGYVEVGAWSRFFKIQESTYENLTAEFMATYKLTIEGKDWPNAEIQFQLLGKRHSMTITAFSVLMGLYETEDTDKDEYFNLDIDIGTNSEVQEFWRKISSAVQPYDPGCSKASTLRSYSLRYMHAVLSHSVTGRGSSTGVVSKIDLTFLWSMVERIPIHIGYWLAVIFQHQSWDPRVGTVAIGPYVTRLLKGLGSFSSLKKSNPRVTEPLGFESLIAMKMVTCQKTQSGLEYSLVTNPPVQETLLGDHQSAGTEGGSVQIEQAETSAITERKINWLMTTVGLICQHLGILVPPAPDLDCVPNDMVSPSDSSRQVVPLNTGMHDQVDPSNVAQDERQTVEIEEQRPVDPSQPD